MSEYSRFIFNRVAFAHYSNWIYNISDNIQQFENQPQEISMALVKVIRIILIDNGERWINSNVSVKDLLQQVMSLYQKGKFAKEIRTKILILLCDIVLNYRLTSTYG